MFRHNLIKQLNKALLSQRGIGLVGVMIAAALIVVAALVVSNFLSDQYHQSEKLQISGDCQNIANSLVEYIKKDETSLFITSYGPNSTNGTYDNGLDKTVDGIDRFDFLPTKIAQFSGPGTSMSLNPGNQKLFTAGWKAYNQLNIKNSTNRLIALAGSGDYCCDGLDMNNPNCGAKFYDDATPVPGFHISDKNIEVNLAIDFKESSCAGRRLAPADLPDSSSPTTTDFKVRVTMKRGTPQEKICEGTGSVQRTLDEDASLTILQFNRTNLCSGTAVSPAICLGNADVVVDVQTFKNNASNNCETSCIGNITSDQTCADTASNPGPDLFDSFANAACALCLQSEPGTAFLCRIGEKSWMDTHPKVWEPCETATVKDFDGTTAGNVGILYNPLISGNNQTQRTTAARITLSNLKSMRGYVVDVRAVDTAGNVGPSFCESSPSCASTQPAQFTIMNKQPTFGPIVEKNKYVGAASDQTIQGRDNTLINTAPPKYNTAFSTFTGNYQCADGNPQFQGSLIYNPPLPTGPTTIPHTCTAALTNPDSTVTNIAGNPLPNVLGCNCVGLDCTATLPTLSANGNDSLIITAYNPCGEIDSPPQNWCFDKDTFNITQTGTADDYGSTPNFSNLVTGITPPSKACGYVNLCPNTDGTFTPTNGPCGTPGGWSSHANSGCIPDPLNNYCSVALDPCGRYKISNVPSTIQYSSTLLAVPWGSGAASNQCFEYSGKQVGGNSCETGWCSASGKCYTSCAKEGDACTTASQCDDPSYGVTSAQPGGPTCVANKCTCPTNKSSPSAGSCSPKYCPVLNSCPITVGKTSPSGGACTGCVPWTVSPYGLCVGGHRTRTVTCSGTCCIGPKPATTTTCPDCVTPWGTNMPDKSSITAYQNANPVCASCTAETRTCNNGVISGSFTHQSCSATCVINGACGSANGTSVASAPSSNLCSAGTASSVSGSGPWNWSCNGSGGGTNAACSATVGGCANPTTSPVTLVSVQACSYGPPLSLKNPFTNTDCSPDVPIYPQWRHSANYSNSSQSLRIKLSWQGDTYYCNYSSYLSSGSTGGVSGSMSPAPIPGYTCGAVDWFATSQGWGGSNGGLSGGQNIGGAGPVYTTCGSL